MADARDRRAGDALTVERQDAELVCPLVAAEQERVVVRDGDVARPASEAGDDAECGERAVLRDGKEPNSLLQGG